MEISLIKNLDAGTIPEGTPINTGRHPEPYPYLDLFALVPGLGFGARPHASTIGADIEHGGYPPRIGFDRQGRPDQFIKPPLEVWYWVVGLWLHWYPHRSLARARASRHAARHKRRRQNHRRGRGRVSHAGA